MPEENSCGFLRAAGFRMDSRRLPHAISGAGSSTSSISSFRRLGRGGLGEAALPSNCSPVGRERRARCLVYAGMTRAIRRVLLTGVGPVPPGFPGG